MLLKYHNIPNDSMPFIYAFAPLGQKGKCKIFGFFSIEKIMKFLL